MRLEPRLPTSHLCFLEGDGALLRIEEGLHIKAAGALGLLLGVLCQQLLRRVSHLPQASALQFWHLIQPIPYLGLCLPGLSAQQMGLLGGGCGVASRHNRHCPYPERREDEGQQEARHDQGVKCVVRVEAGGWWVGRSPFPHLQATHTWG